MSGFLEHLFFFLLLSVPIVVLGAFYGDPRDETALRSLPKRYLAFVGACAAVAAVMLALEYVFV